LLEGLEHSVIFKSGLPSIGELKVPAIARVFSAVLRTGFVLGADFTGKPGDDALQQCFHRGWLHADKLDAFGMPYKTGYLFPSPLHQWFVEWKLSETLPDISFDESNLLAFVVEVISHYSPANLTGNRRVGPGCIQRPPEAQYQDEFYRCSHDRSNGSVVTFPEFGLGNGRIDLYVPAKKWGVEIVRNGQQLEQHSGRFSRPELYARSFPCEEHIILDFRDSHPATAHPGEYIFVIGSQPYSFVPCTQIVEIFTTSYSVKTFTTCAFWTIAWSWFLEENLRCCCHRK
jgi:hypothetical protein